MMKKWLLVAILSGLLMIGFYPVAAEENLLPVWITKCPRANIVEAEAKVGEDTVKIRIKLAGLKPPLAYPTIYQEAQAELKKMVEEKEEIYFDFALGYTPTADIWVGYLYFLGEEGDWVTANEELIKKGFSQVGQETAGENLLSHLLALEAEAKENNLGLWEIENRPSTKGRRDRSECPSCTR